MGMAPGYPDIAVRNAIMAGRLKGPRILASGHGLTVTGGHMDGKGLGILGEVRSSGVADGADTFRRAARIQLKRGADHLKINASGGAYSDGQIPGERQMTLEEVAAVCDEAHRDNRIVGAHAMGTDAIAVALEGGVDTIEHGYWLTDEQMGFMKERNVYLVPTLSANVRILENWRGVGLEETNNNLVEQAAEANRESVLRAYRTGVKIAAGSDGGTPFNKPGTTAYELELLVEAGLSPMDALLAATGNAAECLGVQHLTGTLELGKSADLILIARNPLEDIRVLQNSEYIRLVMARGEIIHCSPGVLR